MIKISQPARVQQTRHKPWRAEHPKAVLVGRNSKWGNPYVLKEHGGDYERDESVRLFREALLAGRLDFTVDDVRRELAGKDLVCWCPLDQECHADVLLELANELVI